MKVYNFFIYFLVIFLGISLNSYVFADNIETSSNNTSMPTINARSAILYDRNSGLVLFGKNENEKRKMASTTKIMTAIIVLENSNLDDIVTISSKAAGTGGSRLGLHTNDKISVKDLLYGLLLCSGNDSAVALAEYVGGDVAKFAELMNKKCLELGLTSSHFVTPHGLDDDNHYTTAYELAIITNYALYNETFLSFVGTKNHTVSINGYPKTLSNTNELLGYLDGVYGVKTGFTNGANRCLVSSVKRGNLDLICIVLGSDTKKDRTNDSIKLIEYAFTNFELIDIKNKVQEEFDNWLSYNYNNFIIEKGCSNYLNLTYEQISFDFLPVNCNQINNVCIYIYCTDYLTAPVFPNNTIGYITISIDNKQVAKLNIYNSNMIEKKSCFDFFIEMLNNYVYHLESIFFY